MTPFDVHRGGSPPDTPCPSDLELARFVEGTLPADARTRMVSHLATCDDCREVVATVVAAQEADGALTPAAAFTPAAPADAVPRLPTSSLRSVAIRAGAFAAAALIVFAVRGVTTRLDPPAGVADASDWSELAQVVGAARTIEPRLSGLPAHVPQRPPTRAVSSDAGFAAQALAARLAERAALPSADARARRTARHLAAVAALVAGRAEDAVARLEAVLAELPATPSERANLLADLSAAYGAMAGLTTGDQWAAALSAADQALAADAGHEAARFNRALALERLDRSAEALAAWQSLAADAAVLPGWRDEAARHARGLAP